MKRSTLGLIVVMAVAGLAGVAGCSSDPAGTPASSGTEAGADTAADTGTDTATDAVTDADCAFKGTYTLEKYLCGTTDITADWKSVVPTDTLVVTDRAGGGCAMIATHEASACVEAEGFEATAPSGSTYQFEALGVTSCSPSSCKFSAADAPCAVGDRAKPKVPATIVAEGVKLRIQSATAADSVCAGEDRDLLFTP